MARYTGPVCRLCRRYGVKLMLKGDRCYRKCAVERRSQPPGYRLPRRRRISDRAVQLREKQKARFTYGVLERQFRRYYKEAVSRPGVTGDNLIRLLELRLDNVVYRLGLADSRSQARQLVCHGHILVNGRKTGIASAQAKAGDIIGWSQSGKKSEYYKVIEETIKSKTVPEWLALDTTTLVGRVVRPPEPVEAGATFDPLVIVEYYSR
ncbi:MAG: 30S ribosomal protein S4 [Dehalococcoidia bacterium]